MKAAESLDGSIAALAEDLSWRRAAAEQIGPGLATYSERMTDTIGLRQREKLPRDQALYVRRATRATGTSR